MAAAGSISGGAGGSAEPPRSFASALRSVLSGPGLRAFRLLFATRLVGQFTDGAFQAALASYVVFNPQNAATPGKVAAAFAVLLLPFTVVGPFAGVFLDRWDRRQVLITANLIRAVVVVLVTFAAATHAPLWLFYVGALAVVSVNRFVLAGLSAALPHTVPANQLVTANAVCPTAGTMATAAGAVVSFIARAVFGPGTAGTAATLGSTAVLYALAALCALAIGRRKLGPFGVPAVAAWTALRSVAAGLAEGARHVAARPRAGRPLLAIAAARFCYGAVTLMTLLLCRNYFNNPADTDKGLAEFAVAAGISAVGFGVGAVVTPFVARRLRLGTWIAVCLALAGVAELLGGLPFQPAPLFAGAGVLGLASQGQKISTDTRVQTGVDDAFRGRVFVYYDMLYNGAYVLAVVVSASLLPVDGRSYAVVIGVAVLYGLAALWFAGREVRPGAAVDDAIASGAAGLSPGVSEDLAAEETTARDAAVRADMAQGSVAQDAVARDSVAQDGMARSAAAATPDPAPRPDPGSASPTPADPPTTPAAR